MKKNFIIGMSMGLAVGACTAYAVTPKKHSSKAKLIKAMGAVSDIVDSVADYMGW